MPLPSSGAISFSDINVELGVSATATRSLNDSTTRSLFGKASGAISMFDGRGKANNFALAFAADQTNVNLRSAALAAGWDGASKVIATINAGVTIYSTSTGSYSLTINGSFPGGVELVNNGTILGKGGNGAAGSSMSSGLSGGPALLVQSAVSITNNGRIAGGGGGGGAGSAYTYCTYQDEGVCYSYATETGAGGGGGIGNGAAGGGGSVGSAGGAGTLTAAGSGGSPNGGGWYAYVGYGGAGGSFGSSGANGSGASNYPNAGYSGGAAGACLVGNSNITWVSTGTRNGSIS